ncbi:MAG: hypothetical protein H0X17_08010 [Deltaproteobacteria bacterium]|nr:hypothetical protein [Deltaproteobacteria bacterium]
MMKRTGTVLLAILLATGCMRQVNQAIAPEPEGGGTLSCAEIVTTCDSECTDPLCLHRCTMQGTAEARPLHDALLDCGQRNGCTDEDCMRASCPAEIAACVGPDAAPAAPPAPP